MIDAYVTGRDARPTKDMYHETVKRSLIKDGWIITHDPYTISFGLRIVLAFKPPEIRPYTGFGPKSLPQS